MMIKNCLEKIISGYIPSKWILNSEKKLSPISYIKVCIFSLILPSLVLLCSYFDDTLFLSRNGKGFFQHYAVWTFYITTPLLIILIILVLNKFVNIITNIKEYIKVDSIPKGLKVVINMHIESLSLKNTSKYILFFFCIIGAMFSILNIIQTTDPVSIFGNDVFDSYQYWWGFLSNKIYLTVIWSIIYPVILFIVFHVTFSTISILKYVSIKDILFIDFFNEDNCGGASKFGTLSFLIMMVYLIFFIIIFSLFKTHSNKYFTLMLPAISISVFLIIHSFCSVYYIHKIVKKEKKDLIKKINMRLNSMVIELDKFSKDLLILRNHIISVRTYPYTKVLSILKNVVSLLPPMLTFINYII